MGADRDDPKMASIRRSGLAISPGATGASAHGSSYEGATQHAMAIANAPFVKAMVPRNAMSDFGRYGVRHNGAFELRFFNWVFTLGNATGTNSLREAAARAASDPAAAPALADMGTRVREYVHNLPLRPVRRRSSSLPITNRGSSRPWVMAITTIFGRTPAPVSSITSPNTKMFRNTIPPAGTTHGEHRSPT